MALKIEPLKNKKIRVMHLVQALGIGGLERMVVGMASQQKKTMSALSPALVVVYDQKSSTDTMLPILKLRNIQFIEPMKSRGFSLRLIFDLLKVIKKEEISIIHSHDIGPLIYAVLVKLFSFWQVRLFHTQHSFIHINKYKKYQLYEKFFTFFVDELIVVSADLENSYRQIGVRKKIHCIENGVYFPDQFPHLELKRDYKIKLINELKMQNKVSEVDFVNKIWFLYIARMAKGKGQNIFAQIWQQIPKDIRDQCVLIFVGSGPDSEFEENLKVQLRKNFGEDVLFAGRAFEPERWFLASDIFVSTSESEGHPLAPTEALGGACHLLLSDIEGHQRFSKYAEMIPIDSWIKAKQSLEVQNAEINVALFSIRKIISTLQKRKYNEEQWKFAQQVWRTETMFNSYLKLYIQKA